MDKKWIKILIAGLGAVVTALCSLLAVHSSANEPKPDWQGYKVTLSFVDPAARLVVAADREMSVPPNTPIFNSSGQAIAIANLQPGHKIWLYLDSQTVTKSPARAVYIKLVQQ